NAKPTWSGDDSSMARCMLWMLSIEGLTKFEWLVPDGRLSQLRVHRNGAVPASGTNQKVYPKGCFFRKIFDFKISDKSISSAPSYFFHVHSITPT
ncbi:MAG: hypothetical protein KDN04_05760, partial [Verrucomicrobiae bacterium]|nr:hypothetical protein [Verrucomicrobiae bacterium]